MTVIRRCAVLIALVAGALSASGLAAHAAFTDTAAVTSSSMSISTGTVAAPSSGPGSLTCGSRSATMGLTWTKSTSTRVTGYLVTVYFSDGYVQTAQKTATDTSWSQSIDPYYVTAYAVRYSVTTQTDYRWTAESVKTGWFQC